MNLIVAFNAPFSIAHIIYLILNIIWFIVGAILIKKYVKDEKTKILIIRISGLLLIITVTIMRIIATIEDIRDYPLDYKWYHVFPQSYCSFTSFTLGFAALFFKKDNIVFHFAVYMAIYGGGLSTIYPEYLSDNLPFFSLNGVTSLLHHSLQLWIVTLILTNKFMIPSYKKIYAMAIGFGSMLLVGVFELFVLKYPAAMNLTKPLSEDIGPITSWYVLYIASIFVTLFFVFILKNIYKKTNEKEAPANQEMNMA